MPAPIVNGGDSFWKWKDFQLSRARDLDLGLGHTAHCRVSLIDLYLHVKFHWNRINFLWTDGLTFETHFIRSTQKSQPKKFITLWYNFVIITNARKYCTQDICIVKQSQVVVHTGGLLLEMLHGLYVCLSVGHIDELCNNSWTNRDTIWELTHVGPRNHILDGVQIPHVKGHFWGSDKMGMWPFAVLLWTLVNSWHKMNLGHLPSAKVSLYSWWKHK